MSRVSDFRKMELTHTKLRSGRPPESELVHELSDRLVDTGI